jgi:hypothetical protein
MSHDIIKRALNDYSHPGLREELEYEQEPDEALQKAIDEGREPDDKAPVIPHRTRSDDGHH